MNDILLLDYSGSQTFTFGNTGKWKFSIDVILTKFLFSLSLYLFFLSRDFDQTGFFENNDAAHNGMDDNGYIFIPSRYIEMEQDSVSNNNENPRRSCSDGELSCHLHVHFHGCGMERGWLGDGYIQRTGFLPLAEANNIVMIFPQVSWVEV